MDAETHELIAGYALDALDPDDTARVKRLLETSEEAREELRALSDVAAAMATATSGPAPRPELRDRILDTARAEPPTVVSLEAHRRSKLAPVLGGATALAAVVALVLGLWGVSTARDRDDARAALEAQQAANAVLADPDARSVGLETGDGRLVVGADGTAVLILDDTGPAPAGMTYEVWVSDGGAPVPAGLFEGTSARDVVVVGEPVDPGSQVLVTIEESGGVDAPTSQPIVASQPA